MAKKRKDPKGETLAALGVERNVTPPAQRLKTMARKRPPPRPRKEPPEPAWRAPLVDLEPVKSLRRIKAGDRAKVLAASLDADDTFDPGDVLKLENLARLELRVRGKGPDLASMFERFAALRRLVWLNVRWADDMPPSIGALRGLRELCYRGDWGFERGPTALPDELFNLGHLERLDLSGGMLRAVPEGLGRLRRLRWLDLGANRPLSRLPESLGTLTHLRWLDLQFPNDLAPAHVLPIVARLPRLPWFRYRSERVTSLPDCVGDLRVECLNIGRAIQKLPDSIRRLSTTRALIVEFNDLRSLPRALTELPRLESLYLHSNPRLDVAQAVSVAVACKQLRFLLLPPAPLPLDVERVLVDAGFEQGPSMYGALWKR